MTSSEESSDDSKVSKSNKKVAPSPYQSLLNSHNTFTEMLKNKLKTTASSSSPTFNPVASSTHIGTPDELKQNKNRQVSSSKSGNGTLKKKAKRTKPVDSDSSDSLRPPPPRVEYDSDSNGQSRMKGVHSDSSSSEAKEVPTQKTKWKSPLPPSQETETEYQVSRKTKKKHKKHRLIEENGAHCTNTEIEVTPTPNQPIIDDNRLQQRAHLSKYKQDNSLTAVTKCFDIIDKVKSKRHVYIVEIPIKVDPLRLTGTAISLTETAHVNKKYDSTISDEKQAPIGVCNGVETIRIFEPTGSIRLQRRVRSETTPPLPNMVEKPVEFPTNLKIRHPLFGSDFDQKIKLDEHIAKRLETVRDEVDSKHEKKKERKKRRKDTEEQPEEEIFKFLTQGNEEKTKKKRQESTSISCESDEIPTKKKKKKKKLREDSDDDVSLRETLLSQLATLEMKIKNKKK